MLINNEARSAPIYLLLDLHHCVTQTTKYPFKLEQLFKDGQPNQLTAPPPASDYLSRVEALRGGLR